MSIKHITVRGARQHNLKNINVEIPRNQLTVITGLSGSGKSSLAFDTIYAEGQRRYVESLSAYARQFLDQLEKPDVDSVEGLSPAISIEQKTVSRSPRSTVGTVTEIYDYLRLLFSSIGQPHCHQCDLPITRQTTEQIVFSISELPEGERVMILAPIVRGRKGEFKKELEKLHKDGFIRARIDNELRALDEEIKLDKRKNHTIEVVVDRLLIKDGIKERLTESVKTALRLTGGAVLVSIVDGDEKLYSEKMACINCGINIATLEPRSFSFNSAYGACKKCQGLGTVTEIDRHKILPDQTEIVGKIKFLNETDKSGGKFLNSALMAIIERYVEDNASEKSAAGKKNKKAKEISPDADAEAKNQKAKIKEVLQLQFADLPPEISDAFWNGTKKRLAFQQGGYKYEAEWKGAVRAMRERMENPPSEKVRAALEELVSPVDCPVCEGKRLQPESLAVKVSDLGIADYVSLTMDDAVEQFNKITLNPREEKIAGLVLKEIRERLQFLQAVGLGYLTLDRGSATLSGGEGQRIRLATQIGSQLRGVLYVLDEPSIGLHPRDNQKLLETLHELRDLGNTVLVVEHDAETIEQADYVVDLGPLAGTHGGAVMATGTPKEVEANPESLTGKYLSGALKIEVPEWRRLPNGSSITVKGARAHNLKNIDATFPLGVFTVVTGVSGSGKSTLVEDILYPALYRHVYKSAVEPLAHDSIEGLDLVDKIIEIDQSPIGRTPRSNPVTYIKAYDAMREVFAATNGAKAKGFTASHFSFNVPGGRCETCQGSGTVTVEMQFLADVELTCEDCRGTRFRDEILDVKYKGKNIAEVLQLTVREAILFFKEVSKLTNKLKVLEQVGLEYLRLGQSATTLSGGEAQRVKLAAHLALKTKSKTLFIFDEPTTGLHFDDINKLLAAFRALIENGGSLLVIEHNLDVIKTADYVIDLGPEGGIGGGEIVATGTPEAIMKVEASHTGRYLKQVLK